MGENSFEQQQQHRVRTPIGNSSPISSNHDLDSLDTSGGSGGNRAAEDGSPTTVSNNNSNSAYSVEYLAQLLKDKKQLAAFPNVFNHIERLIDEEINKVRIALFQFEFTNKDVMTLPEAEGEVVTVQEKVFVPIKDYPDYNFVGRILGPRGMTAKQLEQETGCKIMVRGRGSMRDRKKEDGNRGKPNWEHLQDELHVLVQCEDTANRARVKLARAVQQVQKLLVPSPEGEDDLKRKQLMELAIINGTYRPANQNKLALQSGGHLMPTMTLASPSLGSPTLGAPLLMSPSRPHVAAPNPLAHAPTALQTVATHSPLSAAYNLAAAAAYHQPVQTSMHPSQLIPTSPSIDYAGQMLINSLDPALSQQYAALLGLGATPLLAAEYPSLDLAHTAGQLMARH